MKKLNDVELVAGIRSGDDSVKSAMYLQYRDEFVRWALGNMKVPDATEALTLYTDACVAAWDKISSGGYVLKPGVTFKTYLFSVAANIWRNQLRAESRRPVNVDVTQIKVPDDSSYQAPDALVDISEPEDAEERKRNIVRDLVFNHMVDPCRSIFRYTYYEKLQYKAIALRMSYASERVVVTMASRCRKKLEAALRNRFKEAGLI